MAPPNSVLRCPPGLRLATAALVLVALLAVPAASQRNAHVLQRNLAQLLDAAHDIVRGRVVSVHAEPHPQYHNLQTVVVTLEVYEVLKGKANREFTFRQFNPDLTDPQSHLGYQEGQEILLMMLKPSDYGLSSPAGLDQGRFRVLRDAHGNRTVVNGFNNMGLFRGLEKSAPGMDAHLEASTRQLMSEQRSGAIAFSQFKELLRALASARNE